MQALSLNTKFSQPHLIFLCVKVDLHLAPLRLASVFLSTSQGHQQIHLQNHLFTFTSFLLIGADCKVHWVRHAEEFGRKTVA